MGEKYKSTRKKLAFSIVGLTASGKTSFLHSVIDRILDLGISFVTISADSGSIYKYLDIGTAKPSIEERTKYKYRLLDIVNPCERYSLARFISDVDSILKDEKVDVIFVVGGTPLYFYTLVGERGYIPVEPDNVLRQHLYELALSRGKQYVYDLMKQFDPISAIKIHPNDLKRIIRTIEIVLATGKMRVYSTLFYNYFASHFREYRYIFIPSTDVLRKRIEQRIVYMFENGWIEEIGFLAEMCPPPAPWFEVLGYKHIYDLYVGKIKKQDAVEKIFLDTWKFARRQRTWFRKDTFGVLITSEEEMQYARDSIIRHISEYSRNR